MRINFFDWVREGVRQSILLGLSDAADEIGSEKDVEVLNQQLLSSLDQGRIVDETAKTSRGRRKALGRSLSQIVEAQSRPPPQVQLRAPILLDACRASTEQLGCACVSKDQRQVLEMVSVAQPSPDLPLARFPANLAVRQPRARLNLFLIVRNTRAIFGISGS